ncbi:MAG: hypothetical protein EBR30_02015 [Cytophagia bacterium]|nr:hypothetical protein [Cytophagia bacterium]
MADFSLTTLFVVPVGQSALPSSGSTQDLTPGQVGVYKADYSVATAGNIASSPYFYIAQGRTNTYLQGSKRSDKIKGCPSGVGCNSNVTEWYKVAGCPTPVTQITDVVNWNVQCGDIVTLTLRAHSSYLDTLYFNGFTRSVTVNAPCCQCDGNPCDTVDIPAFIDDVIYHLNLQAPGNNPDNITFSDFYQFQRIGNDQNAFLRITGKPLTKYGQPCDVAAFPFEYDRMWFRTFVFSGPATTADFIVADACNVVADPVIVQRSSYAVGTSAEIAQLEKNFYSYQAGYLKHLYRMGGYNENFESWVSDGTSYDTYYIKFNELDKSAYSWGDYIKEDSTVIIAVESGSNVGSELESVLVAGLGAVSADNLPCITTTSTTTTVWPSTSTTTTLIP